MTTFSTRAEAVAAVQAAREVVERLPFAGFDVGPSLSALDSALAAVESAPLVAPADALHGTVRFREVHGLVPLTEEN